MRAEERAKQLLKAEGLNVYEPGEHIGKCKAPYTVVHCYGNYQTVQSTRLTYTLMLVHCYVPLEGNQTAELSTLVERVKQIMKGMKNQAKPTGREEPDMIESEYGALSRTIEYQILKANH